MYPLSACVISKILLNSSRGGDQIPFNGDQIPFIAHRHQHLANYVDLQQAAGDTFNYLPREYLADYKSPCWRLVGVILSLCLVIYLYSLITLSLL